MKAEDRKSFIDGFTAVQGAVHETAKEKGWWEGDRTLQEALLLIHSEISEATEAARKGMPGSEKIPYGNFEEELADTVIRIMDLCEAMNFPLAEVILEKIAYNKTRPYKHGGKEF